MKVSSSAYALAICWIVVVFGCLAISAQCRSSHHVMKQEVIRHKSSGLFLSTSPANNRSSFHTEVDCQMADNAGGAYGGDKLTLIFCAMKCHCGHNHYDDVCFCCQLSNDGSGGPVCYDKLVDCQANCPLCNPKCPPAPSLGSSLHE